ncbi:EF-P 5-aminopentanol modification-associated protein YfmF [Sporosarcina sp. JAI121]|uniref:EF-P 5-aminopentanol modification-associated protein YfmF n=1 Tax=Sporosarcina sp. JAI121 TaxID=2723064 RepID=UPI0015CA58CA|nr:pitrilysin family protein [Sporosarcina sp. JAI121]NYF24292.1 putative Zn-dependent peptidase [Sporosarcina sp. JAI121]
MFKKVGLQEGVTLYIRKSEQFKTVNFSVKWKTALDEKKAAHRAVLANVLEDSNGRYQTQTEFRNALDELYGTVLYTDAGKRAETHIVSLSAECVNDEYISEGGVLDEVLSLIQTVIFDPNIKDGKFDDTVVTREKRSVKDRIRSVYDDKTRYAQKRMLELLRPDSAASASSYGTEKDVEALTSADLFAAYESMINDDEIDIYVVGDIDENEMTEKIKSLFTFNPRTVQNRQPVVQQTAKQTTDIKHVLEKQDMKQGKLHLGFSTPVTFGHPDYAKMQVTNGVFGGFAHSKLFMNVREKESMAYYASSSYSSHYGLLYVMAGIDAELEEKAVNLIKEQLSELQAGEITDLEIEQTQALLANGIKSAFDSARGQIEVFDQYKELDENFTADSIISGWEAVTKEDIRKMASEITLEIVYLLSGKGAN